MCVCVCVCVCVCGALQQAIYVMLIGYTIYTKVGLLVNTLWCDKYTHNIPLLLKAYCYGVHHLCNVNLCNIHVG